MKDGESLSAALRPNSELSHPKCEGSDFSFVERQETTRDAGILPSELAASSWGRLRFAHGRTALRDVRGDLFRFRQRADPLVIIELRSWVFELQDQLRVEQEATLLRQVSCDPLDREDVEAAKEPPSGSHKRRQCHPDVPPDHQSVPEYSWAQASSRAGETPCQI